MFFRARDLGDFSFISEKMSNLTIPTKSGRLFIQIRFRQKEENVGNVRGLPSLGIGRKELLMRRAWTPLITRTEEKPLRTPLIFFFTVRVFH